MPALAEYANVQNTALLILQTKGFQCWFQESNETYCAERDGWDFMADSPLGLLGLIAIYEFKQPTSCPEYWWREEGAWLLDSLPRSPKPYTPIWARKRGSD